MMVNVEETDLVGLLAHDEEEGVEELHVLRQVEYMADGGGLKKGKQIRGKKTSTVT